MSQKVLNMPLNSGKRKTYNRQYTRKSVANTLILSQ